MIELAIVLAIIALIATVSLQALTTGLVTSQISATKSGELAIKAAIINYVLRNYRLPCPATEGLTPIQPNYGREARIAAGCDTANLVAITIPIGAPAPTSFRGVVPWLTLGLSDEGGADGFNRRYSYSVTADATDPAKRTASTLPGLQGRLTLHNNIPVSLGAAPAGNQLNACSSVVTDKSCNLEGVAMIISHGTNGDGATLLSGQRMPPISGHVLEAQNSDSVNESFVTTDYSDNAANPFDDIVLAIAPSDILSVLMKDGSVASSQSTVNDLLRRTRDTLIAKIVNSTPTRGLVPIVGSVIMPTDVWGNALTYAQNTTDVCSAAAGASAFTLKSLGPNKVPDVIPATPANDDIVLSESTASLQTTIFTLGTPCP